MKRPMLAVATVALFVLAALPVFGQVLPIGGTFSDDDGSVHEADIEAIAAQSITRGCNPPTNDRFCPDGNVTRGEMAAFLSRSVSLAATTEDFFDDDNGSPFEGDINRLAAAGITKGCDEAQRLFCPTDRLTRGQMAAFLVRAFAYPSGADNLFVDDDTSIFEGDIDRLGSAGVTKGCNPPTNNRFCPTDSVTRAQMASFLVRALGLDPIPVPTSSTSTTDGSTSTTDDNGSTSTTDDNGSTSTTDDNGSTSTTDDTSPTSTAN